MYTFLCEALKEVKLDHVAALLQVLVENVAKLKEDKMTRDFFSLISEIAQDQKITISELEIEGSRDENL